jgi:hypothetical protein
MTMTRALLLGLIVAALAPVDATPASAQTAYCRPWCVHYGIRGGATNCGFISYEQCKQTATGSTDMCVPNGACPPRSGWGEASGGGWGSRRR